MACWHVQSLHPSHTCKQKYPQTENSTGVKKQQSLQQVRNSGYAGLLNAVRDKNNENENWNCRMSVRKFKCPGIWAVSTDKITQFQRGFLPPSLRLQILGLSRCRQLFIIRQDVTSRKFRLSINVVTRTSDLANACQYISNICDKLELWQVWHLLTTA